MYLIANSQIFDSKTKQPVPFNELDAEKLPPELVLRKYTPPITPKITAKRCFVSDGDLYLEFSLVVEYNSDSANIQNGLINLSDCVIVGNSVVRLEFITTSEIIGSLHKIGVSDISSLAFSKYVELLRTDAKFFVDEVSVKSLNLDDFFSSLNLPYAPKFIGQPYEHQKIGIKWMWEICRDGLGFILADEMGLGKTFQVIFLASAMKEKLPELPILIISPATLCDNWKREFSTFAPEMDVYIHRGSLRYGLAKRFSNHDVVICSYNMINSKSDKGLFSQTEWALIALDEAQAIKNPDAQRTQAIKALSGYCKIAITGTPLENRLLDVWSIFDFSLPDLLGDVNEFESRFQENEDCISFLEQIISPFIIRRKIAEVIDMPSIITYDHEITMHDSEREVYSTYLAGISEGPLISQFQLERMFCCYPQIVKDFNEEVKYHTKLSHLKSLMIQIKERNEKLVIFTSYTKMVDILVHLFADMAHERLSSHLIDGRNSSDALPIIKEFSESSGFNFLVLNPKAAGVGLNITAASHVIHYNPEWNPATTKQATARVYRIGQEKSVIVHWLFYSDTIESRMVELLDRKEDLFQNTIKGVTGEESSNIALLEYLRGE